MCRRTPIDSKEAVEIVCYPRPVECNLESRIRQLRSLGIGFFLVSCKGVTVKEKVLGVGHVGVVVKGLRRDSIVAVKIRRVDADRPTLEREAESLKVANSAGVGPKLISHTKDMIVMEYVEGEHLASWLSRSPSAHELCTVLKSLLYQCRKLDRAGLDHGELSRPHKHVMVHRDLKVYILDFESASTRRKPRNVTSICSYLFLKPGNPAQYIRETLGIDLHKAIKAVREYSKKLTDASFIALIDALNLSP